MSNLRINDGYWMDIVRNISKASTCRVDIGTLIVRDKIIVAHGVLGSVAGDHHCADKGCLEVSNNGLFGSSDSGISCIRTVHSEMNAILKCNVKGSDSGGWLECYTTYKPCLNCMKALLAIGARKIVYDRDYIDKWRDLFLESTKIDCKLIWYKS